MGESMKQYLKTRNYSARGQSVNRVHRFQYLEKKKGWKERARRNKSRVDLIRSLAEKSRTKNPEEFSCKMLSCVHSDKIEKKGGKVFALDREKATLLQGNNVASVGAQNKVEKVRKKVKERQKDMEKKGGKFLLLKKQILQKRLKRDALENPLIFRHPSTSKSIDGEEPISENDLGGKSQEPSEKSSTLHNKDKDFKWERKRKVSSKLPLQLDGSISKKQKDAKVTLPEEYDVRVTEDLSTNLKLTKRIKHLEEKIELKMNLEGRGKRFQMKADENVSKLPTYKWFGERKK